MPHTHERKQATQSTSRNRRWIRGCLRPSVFHFQSAAPRVGVSSATRHRLDDAALTIRYDPHPQQNRWQNAKLARPIALLVVLLFCLTPFARASVGGSPPLAPAAASAAAAAQVAEAAMGTCPDPAAASDHAGEDASLLLPDVDEESEVAPGEAVVALAAALVNIESISGGEHRMAKALEAWLRRRGWEVTLQPVAPAAGHEARGERWNVYAHRPEAPPAAKGGPPLLLNTHIDTVPPYYTAVVDRAAGVVRGRGACDTKGILAAQLLAAQRLVKAGKGKDVGLLYVVSEETDHSGMVRANDLGLQPRFLIVGEPTESKMIRSQKGILKLRLLARGKSCHSGYPHLGASAIDPLVDCLHALKHAHWPTDATLGDTTLNIGLLSGGHAANALAAEAEATVMFRVISPPGDVLKEVERHVDKGAGGKAGALQVQVITANDPVKLSTLEGYPTDVASFNTDIAYFRLPEKEGKAFLIGPGSILDAHSDHEEIKIEELQRAVGYYEDIVGKLLTQRGGGGGDDSG